MLQSRGAAAAIKLIDVHCDDAGHGLNRRDHFAQHHRLAEPARGESENVAQRVLDGGQHLVGFVVGIHLDVAGETKISRPVSHHAQFDERIAGRAHGREQIVDRSRSPHPLRAPLGPATVTSTPRLCLFQVHAASALAMPPKARAKSS